MSDGGGDQAGQVTPVDHALDQLVTSLDHLVKVVEDGGLDHYDDAGLLGFVQLFELVRNRLSLVDHRVVADGEARGLPATVVQPSMRGVLVQLLGVSPSEASRRVLAAALCGERLSIHGEVLAPARPLLAAAQRDGLVSPEQVQVIAAALAKVDRVGFDPADVEAGERLLTDFAVSQGCKDLRLLADRTVDAINPDGTLPDDQVVSDRRLLLLRRARDGMFTGELRLTPALGAKLTALLGPLSAPRVDPFAAAEPGADAGAATGQDAARAGLAPVAEVDQRSFGQRCHDALEEVCDRVLRAGDVVGVGGVPATVIVTVTAEDLVAGLGYGTTTDGTLLSAGELLRLAGEAEIVPAVMSRADAVLSLGRTRRIASGSQTYALVARDKGCSFPACDRPPEWCERHHIVAWVDGGTTDLANLTLLCRFHHHNFASRGWRCQLNPDGLPEWRPPRWVDRGQKPLVNSRITAQLDSWRQRRRPRRPVPETSGDSECGSEPG